MKRPQTEYDIYKHQALDLFSRTKSAVDVRTFIDGITDDDYRDHTFAQIAVFLAEQGNLHDALDFCDAICRPLERADAFLDIARQMKKLKSAATAKEILKSAIEAIAGVDNDPWETTTVFLEVGSELWQLGEKDEALALVERSVTVCENHPDRIAASKTLAGCARAMRRWDHIGRAKEIAQMVEPPTLRKVLLEEL